MAYSYWSVIAGEQPTTAKWNILGSNDSSFNDGSGLAFTTNNVVPANSLTTNAILLGTTGNFTTSTTTTSSSDVGATGYSITVTVPAGGRSVQVIVYSGQAGNPTGGAFAAFDLYNAAGLGGSNIARAIMQGSYNPLYLTAIETPSAGSHTYSLGMAAGSGGTAAINAGSGAIGFMAVIAI